MNPVFVLGLPIPYYIVVKKGTEKKAMTKFVTQIERIKMLFNVVTLGTNTKWVIFRRDNMLIGKGY